MRITLSEQDVIDACSVYVSRTHGGNAMDVQVDLQFEEFEGISADTKSGFRNLHLTEQDVIDAVALFLTETQQLDPADMLIDLFYEEDSGIGANVEVSGGPYRW